MIPISYSENQNKLFEIDLRETTNIEHAGKLSGQLELGFPSIDKFGLKSDFPRKLSELCFLPLNKLTKMLSMPGSA